jgi:hypothetical protein
LSSSKVPAFVVTSLSSNFPVSNFTSKPYWLLFISLVADELLENVIVLDSSANKKSRK